LDKAKQVELLTQALNEIPHLRVLHFRNGEFAVWKNKVCQILESDYGKESAEYRRFVDAPGKAFVVRTEMGQEQEYHRQLDCYEETLKSLIN
jgi:hypothetical protein